MQAAPSLLLLPLSPSKLLLDMSSDKPTITEIPVVVKNPNGVDQIIITAGIKIPHGYYAIVWGVSPIQPSQVSTLHSRSTHIFWQQRIATNPQRFNAYILDENKIVISDPSQDGLSLKWDASAPAHLEQFKVTQAYPPTVPPDPRVFFFGPYKKTRYVGISCFHSDDDGKTFKQSKIKEQFVCRLHTYDHDQGFLSV